MKTGRLPSPKISRRKFFKYGFRLSALTLAGTGFEGRNNIRLEKLRLGFTGLPPAFDGYRIVQISDLHAGFWVPRHYLNRVVDQINGMPADLLAVTGDFISGANRFSGAAGDDMKMVSEVLGRVKHKPCFGVLGNHDQMDGPESERRLIGLLEKAGMRILRNESAAVERGGECIRIAGTDDHWYSGDLTETLKHVPPEDFTILLTHNPDLRSETAPRKRIDLTLCGHTHGGQVRIPYLTRYYLPIRNPERYLSGLVREGRGFTYVNRGIGTLMFPIRLGADPEITHITLERRKEA